MYPTFFATTLFRDLLDINWFAATYFRDWDVDYLKIKATTLRDWPGLRWEIFGTTRLSRNSRKWLAREWKLIYSTDRWTKGKKKYRYKIKHGISPGSLDRTKKFTTHLFLDSEPISIKYEPFFLQDIWKCVIQNILCAWT